MAFKLGDIVVDRILLGVAENFDGELLYILSQLADGTIDITAESKDAVDATGTLVKRFWQGKTGTFTANNAMLNVNIMAAKSGVDAITATAEVPVDMPKIDIVNKGEVRVLKDFIEGTVRVYAYANGVQGEEYAKGTAASATEYALTEEGALTLPTDAEENQFIIKYQRKVSAGTVVKNLADKFPRTIKLTLKVLAVDPCQADTLKAAYIEMPSFQPSPELSVNFTTDAQLEYSGDLQVAYCDTEKVLFNFYWADEDEE